MLDIFTVSLIKKIVTRWEIVKWERALDSMHAITLSYARECSESPL